MTTAIQGTIGKVMSCTDDLSVVPRYVSGNERVKEALYRRFTTTRGDLIWDEDYGTNVFDFLQMVMTQAQLSQIPGQLKAEALKDPRVTKVQLTAVYDLPSKTLSVALQAYGPEGLFAMSVIASPTGVTFS